MNSRNLTVLDTPFFRVSADAECGGKITELFHHRLGRNLLATSLPEAHLTLEGGECFQIAGWDEAFPSLEPCDEIPTLGHAWRMPADCRIIERSLFSQWRIPHWRLLREINISQHTVSADYTIANLSNDPATMLWAAHVLFPLTGFLHAELPAEELHPGTQCDVDELCAHLHRDAGGWRIEHSQLCGRSWKFFLPAERDVVLHYADAVLTLSTTAPWWGIWLNLGAHQTTCLGIEPTTVPTDVLPEVTAPIAGRGLYHVSWQVQVQPCREVCA